MKFSLKLFSFPAMILSRSPVIIRKEFDIPWNQRYACLPGCK
jgi:hypothetical protein